MAYSPEELAAAFADAQAAILNRKRDLLRDAGELVEQRMVQRLRKRTGRLRSSVRRLNDDGYSQRVGPTVEYARYQKNDYIRETESDSENQLQGLLDEFGEDYFTEITE